MPLIQPGQGSIPSKGELGLEGMGDALQSFVESYQKEKKDQEAKKQSNDDIIKAGLSSKTMRPAKDGEKSDFSDSSGRGWVYDDSNLKAETDLKNTELQGTAYQRMLDSGAIAAQHQNIQWGTPEYDKFMNEWISRAYGGVKNAKGNWEFSDSAQETAKQRFGDNVSPFFNDNQVSGKAGTGAPKDYVVPNPSKGMLSNLFSMLNFMPNGPQAQSVQGVGGQAQNMGLPMNPAGMPLVGQGLPFPVGPAVGRGNAPSWNINQGPYIPTATRTGQPIPNQDPNMQALMSLMAMRGQPVPMQSPGVPPTQQQLGNQ